MSTLRSASVRGGGVCPEQPINTCSLTAIAASNGRWRVARVVARSTAARAALPPTFARGPKTQPRPSDDHHQAQAVPVVPERLGQGRRLRARDGRVRPPVCRIRIPHEGKDNRTSMGWEASETSDAQLPAGCFRTAKQQACVRILLRYTYSMPTPTPLAAVHVRCLRTTMCHTFRAASRRAHHTLQYPRVLCVRAGGFAVCVDDAARCGRVSSVQETTHAPTCL